MVASQADQRILIMGDVELDLRNAVIVDDDVEITIWGLMGDVDVIVPDGVEAELDGLCVMGDRRIELAPVPGCLATPWCGSAPTR